jgi:hypothetical protein
MRRTDSRDKPTKHKKRKKKEDIRRW